MIRRGSKEIVCLIWPHRHHLVRHGVRNVTTWLWLMIIIDRLCTGRCVNVSYICYKSSKRSDEKAVMVVRVLLRNRSSNTPTSARTWGNLWDYTNGTTGAQIRPIVKLRDKQTSKSITSKTIDEYDHKKYNYWLLRLPLSLPLVGKGGEGGWLIWSNQIQ